MPRASTAVSTHCISSGFRVKEAAEAMRPVSRSWPLAVAVSLAVAGCGAFAEKPAAAPVAAADTVPRMPAAPEPAAETLRLLPGETASAADGALEVTFLEVLQDSRCARGETCIWAGEAVVRFQLVSGGQRATIELRAPSREGRAAEFSGWRVELAALEPAPASAATLVVSRGDAPAASLQ
jgi:hypothetical protein